MLPTRTAAPAAIGRSAPPPFLSSCTHESAASVTSLPPQHEVSCASTHRARVSFGSPPAGVAACPVTTLYALVSRTASSNCAGERMEGGAGEGSRAMTGLSRDRRLTLDTGVCSDPTHPRRQHPDLLSQRAFELPPVYPPPLFLQRWQREDVTRSVAGPARGPRSRRAAGHERPLSRTPPTDELRTAYATPPTKPALAHTRFMMAPIARTLVPWVVDWSNDQEVQNGGPERTCPQFFQTGVGGAQIA